MAGSEQDDIPGILRRLDTSERNQSDHARILTSYNEEIRGAKERLDRLEEAHQDRRVRDVEEVAREHAMQSDIAAMKEDIKSIKGIGSKALWVFISAIIVAFAAFMLKGGLA